MRIVIATVCLLLSACSIPLHFVPPDIVQVSRPLAELKSVSIAIAEPSARTGEIRPRGFHPQLWKDAIRETAFQAGLFAFGLDRKVTITILVKRFHCDNFQFVESDIEVNYRVMEEGTGQVLFEQDIATAVSINPFVPYAAADRLTTLLSKTMQDNIGQFVRALQTSGL